MKRVVRVRLKPSPAVADSLLRTLGRSNEAATMAAALYREHGLRGKIGLQPLAYQRIKALGLSAQPALLVISKVNDAYATIRGHAKNGRFGPKKSEKYKRMLTQPATFRPDAAQAYDDRCLSWNHESKTVSIWTVDGRTKDVPFAGRAQDLDLLARFRKGQTDLAYRDGRFYLIATLEMPTPAQDTDPDGFIGVDLGIVNVATTSTGLNWSGGAVTARRKKNQKLRSELQAKGTKSAKRKLKKRSKKETRFAADLNHQISKKIVTEAQRTGRGIALEILTGIRERARLRKPQRVALHSWAFAQLGGFIAYKAEAAGVPLVHIDPAYTSQRCSALGCGYIDKRNRKNQEDFTCLTCGVMLSADDNASQNIRVLGEKSWGEINLPNRDQAKNGQIPSAA